MVVIIITVIITGINNKKRDCDDVMIICFFRCASIYWFQVVRKWVSDIFELAHLRVFQSYLTGPADFQ